MNGTRSSSDSSSQHLKTNSNWKQSRTNLLYRTKNWKINQLEQLKRAWQEFTTLRICFEIGPEITDLNFNYLIEKYLNENLKIDTTHVQSTDKINNVIENFQNQRSHTISVECCRITITTKENCSKLKKSKQIKNNTSTWKYFSTFLLTIAKNWP